MHLACHGEFDHHDPLLSRVYLADGPLYGYEIERLSCRPRILVTCAAKDAAVFERFFKEGVPEERSITYHPQLDRILGGDYFHQYQGQWLKACLASLERAMKKTELLREAQKAYRSGPNWPGKLDWPLPQLLAVLKIPTHELKNAPASYTSLR